MAVDAQKVQNEAYTEYWIGSDGMPYHRVGDTVYGGQEAYTSLYMAKKNGNQVVLIDDPLPGGVQQQAAPTGGGTGGGGTTGGTGKSAAEIAEEQRLAAEAAERASLKNEITGYEDDIEATYGSLFGDLNNLIVERDKELETQYGDQLKKAGEQYTGAIPEIERSYAALGAADSTDRGDAKDKAKKGFDDTTATIGSNKTADKAKLGAYKTETETKLNQDRESARNIIRNAATTDSVDALRTGRNSLQTNLSDAAVTKSTLGTSGSARKAVTDLTKDGGRYEAAVGALDSIIKSSMSGAVKQAAVKAITDSAGLSEEEKKKVNEQYGNVYSEQQAL